jgi:hypothetical protein
VRELLLGVAELGYHAADGSQQPAQKHLLSARKAFSQYLPPLGYRVRASGTAVNLPRIPWLAVLNPDVTKTARSGLYLVYLYDVDVSHVHLTINQGVTAHRERARAGRPKGMTIDKAAIASLVTESLSIREQLTAALVEDLPRTISLGDPGSFGAAYEAGTIAAKSYACAHLPDEATLRADLDRFLLLYEAAVEVRKELTATDPLKFSTPATTETEPGVSNSDVFKPKSAADYIAEIKSHTQVRTRRHEAIVKAFGQHAIKCGWKPVTSVHPRDMVVRRGTEEVLCEIKIVKANAQGAVREAIGQLFTYRYFLYLSPVATPPLLAVFSEAVGEGFVELLEQLGIHSAWSVGGAEWDGSAGTKALGLA